MHVKVFIKTWGSVFWSLAQNTINKKKLGYILHFLDDWQDVLKNSEVEAVYTNTETNEWKINSSQNSLFCIEYAYSCKFSIVWNSSKAPLLSVLFRTT